MPGKFHGQKNMAVYSPWGCKELDMTVKLSMHLLLLCDWTLNWFRIVLRRGLPKYYRDVKVKERE